MRRPLTLALLLAAIAPVASARADFFAAEPVDGPSADIVGRPDIDLARDGSGAVAYVRRDAGVEHAFVSRLVDGVPQAPERLDAGMDGPGSQPVVAAGDGGRLAVAFVNAGTVYVVVRTAGDQPSSAPQPIATGSNPSIDMSINGGAYLSLTVPGFSAADVRVAGLPRDGGQFTLLPDTLDIDPAADAGAGTGRSDVAVSADGTAVVAWGESNHVYARRVFGARISVAPQDLTLPDLGGNAGGVADLPDIDIEDDSSYAQAIFRQAFADGRRHTIARRLVGSQFEAPAQVDGFGLPGGDDSANARIDISGRGEGIVATGSAGFGSYTSILHDNVFAPALLINPGNAVDAQPAVGIAENNDAYAAFVQGTGTADASVHVVGYDIDPAKRTVPPPGQDIVLSNPAFGPVDVKAGLELSVDRAGDALATFVQGTGEARRLVIAGFDRKPGALMTYTTSNYRKFARPPLSWQASFELWAPITYTVEIDGNTVGQTTDTKLVPFGVVPDGVHRWRVIATDRRGQQTAAPVRPLKVDATPPELTFKLAGTRRVGKAVTVSVTAADGSLDLPSGSGIKTVRVDFGDGFKALTRTAVHRYLRPGSYTVRVSATDLAGNAVAQTRLVKIAKPKKPKKAKKKKK